MRTVFINHTKVLEDIDYYIVLKMFRLCDFFLNLSKIQGLSWVIRLTLTESPASEKMNDFMASHNCYEVKENDHLMSEILS